MTTLTEFPGATEIVRPVRPGVTATPVFEQLPAPPDPVTAPLPLTLVMVTASLLGLSSVTRRSPLPPGKSWFATVPVACRTVTGDGVPTVVAPDPAPGVVK